MMTVTFHNANKIITETVRINVGDLKVSIVLVRSQLLLYVAINQFNLWDFAVWLALTSYVL